MINQLELLIKEIIDSINKKELKKNVDFEKYKEHVLKYVKNIDNELIESTYDVMIFETIYINILTVMIEEIIKRKYNIDIKHNILLKKIDENAIFCKYNLESKYINKIKLLLSNKKKINLKFFTDFYEKSINIRTILYSVYNSKRNVEKHKNKRKNENFRSSMWSRYILN